jgi:hypothetical protein
MLEREGALVMGKADDISVYAGGMSGLTGGQNHFLLIV